MGEQRPRGQSTGAETPLLPDFCNAGVVLIVVVGAELLALILTLSGGASAVDFWYRLAMISMLTQWIVLGISLVLCLLRAHLNRLPGIRALVLIYALIIVVTLAMGFAAIELARMLGTSFVLFNVQAEWFLFRLLAISGIVGAVLLRYLYVQQQWRLHLQAQARARVEALQARIHPHFLFNSMNTITSLIRSRPREAEQAVVDLSALFRASLKGGDAIPLGDELEITRHYLDIEQLRIGERLQVEWSIDEGVDKALPVPALSLQPLVENAVYHGIEPRIEGGEITIRVWAEDERLNIRVRNPCPGQAGGRAGHHMAQDNIRQRLELGYGGRAGLEARALDHAYEVLLYLPLKGEAG